jgi:hypothetical protein
VSPFGARGPDFYRYVAEDTVRIQVQGQTVSLVPVSVRPRVAPTPEVPLLVLGTFYLDTQRAAVARARFGFIGNDGSLPASLGRLETFMELDNALWHGQYWLPFQQRREVLFNSKLLGGAVAARVINRFTEMEFNTGWRPTGAPVQLTWTQRKDAFAEWRGDVGGNAGDFSTRDFDDLRIATETADPLRHASRVQLHYERANHLFRYNRVEGAYLGVGARLTPPDPRRERWQLYGTAGWAFAEGTPRGELGAPPPAWTGGRRRPSTGASATSSPSAPPTTGTGSTPSPPSSGDRTSATTTTPPAPRPRLPSGRATGPGGSAGAWRSRTPSR